MWHHRESRDASVSYTGRVAVWEHVRLRPAVPAHAWIVVAASRDGKLRQVGHGPNLIR
jgi:hypothetical protein